MRWSHALVAAMFVLAVAACSSPAASSQEPDGGGSSQGSAASQGAPASQGGAPASQGGGGGGGGDVDDIFNALIPPNSTEVLKTNASGSIFASYTSTDSVESLTSHYQSAIPATGMEIFSTTNAQGGTAWVFAEAEGSSFGGSVSVFPNTDGGGAAVTITVSSGG